MQTLGNYIPLVVLGFIVLFFVAYRSFQYVRMRKQLAQQNVAALDAASRNAEALERIAAALEAIAQNRPPSKSN
jgi:Flp pilus assembly protein TadB